MTRTDQIRSKLENYVYAQLFSGVDTPWFRLRKLFDYVHNVIFYECRAPVEGALPGLRGSGQTLCNLFVRVFCAGTSPTLLEMSQSRFILSAQP